MSNEKQNEKPVKVKVNAPVYQEAFESDVQRALQGDPAARVALAGPAPQVASQPKTIAVKSLTFFDPHPHFSAKTSISHEPLAQKGRISIEFVPSLRHHRVEVHTPDHPPRIVFVQEGHVAGWEPLV
jgi:hypothetical protein